MTQIYMDVDRALDEVPVNIMPLIDDTDFKTVEAAVAYNAAGMTLSWFFVNNLGGMTRTAVVPTAGGVHDWDSQGGGYYSLEIPASGGTINNDTEGFGWFAGSATGVLPWRGPIICFRAAGLNDKLITEAYDAGRGLAGTALPPYAVGTAGGLPFSIAGGLDLDARMPSATATAALEDQYDGTGLIGDSYPATQAQVGNIQLGSAAISTPPKASPDGFVITTGSNEVNDEDSAFTLDGVLHSLEDTANATDAYYIFDVGGSGVPTSVTWNGFLNSQGDSYTFHAWNWSTSAWDQIGAQNGLNGTTVIEYNFILTSSHVGSGVNSGLVHFRLLSADGTKFSTDRVLCNYTIVAQSVGYAAGAIWVDSAGTSGVELYVNGTADNPCTWANALVISAALGIKRFHIANDVTITLDAAFTDSTMFGEHYYLALGGQNINDSYIQYATITGIGSAADHVVFDECEIGAATIPPAKMIACGIGHEAGTFTAASDGDYTFIDCYSLRPGSAAPSLDFTGLGAATGINNRRWAGGATYALDSDCTLSHEVLAGGGTSITTGGAYAEIRGCCRSLLITCTTGGTGTVQFVGTTGPITITGTADATTLINLYGISSSIADDSVNTTVTDATQSVDNIVDQTWDETLSEHVIVGSTGSALNAAGGSGDPWSTALPGAYGAGTAGYIIGTFLDSQVSVIDTNVDAILLDTAELQTDWTDGGRLDLILDDILLDTGTTIPGTLSTGVAVSSLTSAAITDIWSTDTLPESYAAAGAAGTPAQLFYWIHQCISDFVIASTTVTVRKLDGATAAGTSTLDAIPPNARSRTT